jgi:hypothetical protein
MTQMSLEEILMAVKLWLFAAECYSVCGRKQVLTASSDATIVVQRCDS